MFPDPDKGVSADTEAAEATAEAPEDGEREVQFSDGKLTTGDEPIEMKPVTKLAFMKIDPEAAPGNSALAILTPDRLKELAFISTYYSKDPQSTSPRQHGYQREPMVARFKGIGRYYAKEDNRHLLTPIIASVRVYTDKDRARFNFLFNRAEIGKIHAEFGESVFSIVDGQHRLGGLYWAWENIEGFNAEVPVYVYYGLNYTQEANFFDTINTEQRKLPKALIESTRLHMDSGIKDHKQDIREIAFAIAQDGDSVWKDLVNMTGSSAEKGMPITFEGMRRSTGNMFPERLIARLKQRGMEADGVGKKYWEMVARACGKAWSNAPKVEVGPDGERYETPVKYRIKDLVGVAALSRLGQDIITTALDRTRTEDDFWESISDMVSKLGAVDWEKRRDNPWMASSAGFAGMGILAGMLYDLVYLDRAPGESVAPDEVESAPAEEPSPSDSEA